MSVKDSDADHASNILINGNAWFTL